MAKIQKNNLKVLIHALKRINHNMSSGLPVGNDVYGWCQSQAIDLGEYLEEAYIGEADASEVVSELENYCEVLYQLSIEEDIDKRKQITDEITEILTRAENKLETDIPDDV